MKPVLGTKVPMQALKEESLNTEYLPSMTPLKGVSMVVAAVTKANTPALKPSQMVPPSLETTLKLELSQNQRPVKENQSSRRH